MTDLRGAYDYSKDLADEYIGSSRKTTINIAKTTKRTFSDMLFTVIFDWRIIFFTLLSLTLMIAYGLMVVHRSLSKNQTFNAYGLASISFFGHIFILNCFIAIFTLCYYFKKRADQGKQGPRGKIGPKGQQGKNQTCDICSLKVKTMSRDEDTLTDKSFEIDNSLFEDMNKYKPRSWKSYKIDKLLGQVEPCEDCKTIKYSNENYVSGIIGNISSEGIINSFQYLYENDGSTKPLGNAEGIAGIDDRTNVKKVKCPKNSGIFRMDVACDNTKKGISGMKIFCRDLTTGKVKLPKKHTLGNIETKHQTDSVYCTNNDSFIGGLEAHHNDKQLVNLQFNKCNMYK